MRLDRSMLLAAVVVGGLTVEPWEMAGADPPAEGLHRASVGPDGAPRIGDAYPVRVDEAVLVAEDNDNVEFSLRLRVPYDETIAAAGSLVLVAGGRTHVSAGSGASGTTWSHPSFSLRGRDAAEAVARVLRIAPHFRRHPGHRLKVAFVPGKASFPTAERVRATFRLTNVGEAPVAFQRGGRQRAPRDNQYDFLARRDGRLVPDVGTNLHFGGIAWRSVLEPGETMEEEVDLSKWFAFAEPGHYEVLGSYALTFLDPATEGTPGFLALWEDHATAAFAVTVVGSAEEAGGGPAPPTAPDPEGALVGRWSDVVAGLRGRLVTAMDDRDRGTRFVSVYVELQHVHYFASDVRIPADRRVEVEVLDADGKPIPSQGLPWSGPVVPTAEVVLQNHGRIRHKVSGGGCGDPGRPLLCFLTGSWILSSDKAYSVRATLTADPDPRSRALPTPWSGRLVLPATPVDLDPN